MRPLLKVNGDNASKKLPLSVIGSKKYKIHVLFWSHEPDGSKPPEKAAALIFSFSDQDGQPVAAPERLHRTISGEAFRYINLSDTPIMTFDIAVPRSAASMELEIRSWNHKKFSAEITRLELMEPSSVVDAPRDQSIYFPNDLAFTSVPPREMHMRYFLEATLAEQARPRTKFSEAKNPLPSSCRGSATR